MRQLKYDPTVTLGALIQLVVFFVAIAGWCARIEARFATLETKVDALWARATR